MIDCAGRVFVCEWFLIFSDYAAFYHDGFRVYGVESFAGIFA